jgi:hypothetical protein
LISFRSRLRGCPFLPKKSSALLAAFLVLAAAVAVLVASPQAKAQGAITVAFTAPDGAQVVAGDAAGPAITIQADPGQSIAFRAEPEAFSNFEHNQCFLFTNFFLVGEQYQGDLRPTAEDRLTWLYTVPDHPVTIHAYYQQYPDGPLRDPVCWSKVVTG